MAYETVSPSASIDELSPAKLLDTKLAPIIAAITGLESHNADGGGIRTLNNASNPQGFDDMGRYQPGTDHVRSIDPAQTEKAGKPTARKGLGQETPLKYHAIVEYGDRYRQSSGEYTLKALARISLATVALAAQQSGANMDVRVAVDGSETHIIENDEFSAQWLVGAYDSYINTLKPNPKPDGEALTKSMEELDADQERWSSSTDFVVICSDFLGGEERRRKRLAGFSWFRSLNSLHQKLGDRLLAIRLMTPAQTRFPAARTVEINGRPMTFDLGEQMATADSFLRGGLGKTAMLDHIFDSVRSLELHSTDPKPMVTVPKFVFARPALEASDA